MLLDIPESLAEEMIRRYTAFKQAEANYASRPTTLNLKIKNTALSSLEKTMDKCSIELGQPVQPRPTVEPQENGTLKLLYPTP